MVFKIISIAIIAAGFSFNLFSQSSDSTLVLDQLIQEMLKNNSELQSSQYQTSVAQARIRQVTAWDPPQVGVEFYQTPIQSFPNPIKDGMETDYFIQQMFPFPGKLSAMGQATKDNADMVEQDYQALKKKIIKELKSAYYELYLVQRKIQINAENQDLMRQFTEIAKRQYEVGMGKQLDILRSQTELSTLNNQGINLQQEKKSAEARLNTLLNWPIDKQLGYIPDIEIDTTSWTLEQLRPLALENRPELHAMKFYIKMNEAELNQAKREYYPDLMLRVMYKDMTETSKDFWATMVGINIPLAFWSSGKYRGKVEEVKLNNQKAQADLQTMTNMVSFDVQDALVKVQTNQNLLLLSLHILIPQAEQTLYYTRSAYQTGKTEFLMLIDAYRMLWMARLDYHISVTNYMSNQAALEQAVGLSIAEIEQKIR